MRSPRPHADIRAIHTGAACQAPGVTAVITAEEVTRLSASLVVSVRAPIECCPIAAGRVRYVGEPVAVVIAADRYLAEDALPGRAGINQRVRVVKLGTGAPEATATAGALPRQAAGKIQRYLTAAQAGIAAQLRPHALFCV